MRNAFIHALTEAARRDPSITLLTGDLGFTVLEKFRDEFPDRFFNMGVAEQNMIGVAAGLAMEGRRVFVYSIIPFVTLRCLEHVRNDLCFHHLPVCIAGLGSGYGYGHMGPTHHALEDIAAMRGLQGMTVLSPGDPVEVDAAVRAVATLSGPCYLRLGKNGERRIHQVRIDLDIGKPILLRPGNDALLLATGSMLDAALQASDLLAERGINAGVASVHTLQPIDALSIRSLIANIPLIATLEEHRKAGGLGSAIAESLADAPVRPLHLFFHAPDDSPHRCGSQSFLRMHAGLQPGQIADRLAKEMTMKTKPMMRQFSELKYQ